MKKVLLLTCLSLLPISNTLAGSIHGIVSDESGALPDADIILYNQSDTSKVINTDMTTAEGEFSFDNLPVGRYMVKVEYIGYKTKKVNVSLTAAKPDIKAMKLNMKDDGEMLQGIQVTGQRTALHVDPDKKTFLVNANAVVEGTSISDLLREVPSVDVDVEGNVSLRSNENVEIYINGKPAGLSDGNSADILEQMPANSIEKVEVITNPSSKYNAEGEAGIINIILKDEYRTGYYGSVSGGISIPVNGHVMGNLGTSITYTDKKWTLTGALGWQGKDDDGSIKRDRKNYRNGDTTYTKSTADTRRKMNSEFINLGATYRLDDNNTFAWTGMGSLAQRDFTNDYLYDYGDINNGVATANHYNSNYTTTDGHRTVLNTTLGYNHKFAKEGETLDISGSANSSINKNDNDYLLTDLDSLRHAIDGSRSYEFENKDTHIGEYTAQVDYTLPFGTSGKIEFGAKGDWRGDHQKTDTLMFYGDGPYDLNRSSSKKNTDFKMQQNIYAAYVSYSNAINKRFKYNLGLRGELTDMSWEQRATGDKSSKDPYFHLFPSAFLSYTLSETDELQLNYTRRVSRPRMRFINPYVNESDSLNIRYGNPDLDPELTHSIELNYVKNADGDLYTASIYYKLTNDVVSSYTDVVGNVSSTTYSNMRKSQEEGLELIAKNHISILTLTTNINLFYYDLEGGNFNYKGVDENGHLTPKSTYLNGNSSFSWTGKMSADLKLPWSMTGQITANYSSPKAILQGRRHHMFTMNAGLKRSFLDKKLSASFSVRDIFNSFRFKSTTYGDYFDQDNTMQRSGTTFYLNLSYNFGNMNSSKKGKNAGEKDDVEDFSEFGNEN